jgi:hypothetical protein
MQGVDIAWFQLIFKFISENGASGDMNKFFPNSTSE